MNLLQINMQDFDPDIAREFGGGASTMDFLGVPLFDWASLLSDPDDPAKTLYGVSGGHPNDEGCKVISDAFLEQFADRLP